MVSESVDDIKRRLRKTCMPCLLLVLAGCLPEMPVEDRPPSETFGPDSTAPLDRQTNQVEHPSLKAPARLVERVRIGSLESQGPDAFGKIAAIAVDGLGRVYVADRFTQTVQVFDSTGAFVRSIGRDGQGPGEFTYLEGFAWRNDSTLWVLDLGNRRYSEYDTSGVHIQDRRRSPLGSDHPWPGRFDGADLIEVLHGSAYRLVAIDPEASPGPPADTLPYPLAGVPMEWWHPTFSLQTGQTWRRTRIPFTEGFEWSLDGRGGVWVGDTREYRLVRLSLAGDTLLVASHEIMGARISSEERRAAIDALGSGASRLDPSKVPERKPVFRVIIPSDDGGVWLLREGEGTTWLVDILDANGQIIASLDLPVEPDPGILPVLDGSSLWFVSQGPFDLPMVLRFSAQQP